MSFNKPTNITMPEFREINRLYKLTGSEKMTQKAIKASIDYDRMRAGTYKGRGISTNTVSRLSPGSKHRTAMVTKTVSAWGEWDVSHFISRCQHCSLREARGIYFNNVLPISPYNFYDPNNRNMMAIRTGVPSECDAQIYFVISTIGYESWLNEDEDEDEDVPESDTGVKETPNLWTFKTPFTYKDVLKGKLPLFAVMKYIDTIVDEAYEYEFVNTLINVKR